jgi:molybdate/tungstate transport system substrate-binding protein
MNKKDFLRLKTLTIIAAVLILCISGPAFAGAPSGKLVIFHAGSLSVPFAKIEKDFEKRYPRVDVVRQSGGSTKMARLISDDGKPADIMGSTDFKVIDKNLIPTRASWNIRFATNQLVLCYTDKSRFACRVSSEKEKAQLPAAIARWVEVKK